MKDLKLKNPIFIDLVSDFGFKKLFGEDPNKDLLISFLNEVLGGRKRIADLEYARSEQLGEGPEDGGAVFDLLCTGPGGEKFIIEVQRARQKNFRKRAVFYTSRLISNQAPKGNRATWGYDISEVYLIALLDGFTVTDPSDVRYLHDVRLCERETGEVFYEELGYTYIELQKFHKREDELEDDLDRWLFVLKNMARLEKIPVYLRKTIFEKVFNLAAYSKLSREEKMAYDTSLKRKWDEFSIKETAFEDGFDKGKLEGKEEGIEEGADKKARAIARELLKKGLPVDLIAETTGLSREEIEQL